MENEIFLEADLLQEMIDHQARSQEINEHGADWIINGCNIPTELKSFLDDQGHPIKEQKIKCTKRILSVPTVTCPKVPPMLRKRSNEYFDPKILSFGPYHHGKPELQEGETHKTKFMLEFIKESDKSVQEFYSEVRKMNRDNRACYVDGSTNNYDDNKFALMMLRDGCSILYLLDLVLNNTTKIGEVFADRRDILPYILPDMILLENQIPFAVLELLMSLRNNKNVWPRMIKSFIYFVLWGILEKTVTGDENEEASSLTKVSDDASRRNHLLEHIYKKLTKIRKKERQNEDASTMEPEFDYANFFPSFNSVIKLKAKGIHFRPINSSFLRLAKIGKSISLRDVEFSPGFLRAELKLPPLILDPAKIKLYNNLAAFEWCPPTSNDAVLTSYISFLNTLIDSPDDVKELRSKRILLNNVGSDEEVVKMLREITTCERQDVTFYHNVRKAIEKHYNSQIRTWEAEIIYKYFSSPWTVLGLFAAIVVLVLTVVQTCFTVHPVK
ncbi:UPF0481 protein At3g47200-like isoform X2 [Quercus robur]|uniref:UPF0481 protein At3g47200-like isoform X2 n=1 Tax=Quercus robur TaxID=38942 RepID=UPI002163A06B|nr:UPF0481 protein At3g47200-like isoform X2 [Quercus robur]